MVKKMHVHSDMNIVINVLFQKISIHLPRKGFGLNPPPLWDFQLSPILSLKFWLLGPSTPLDLPWGGYGYFLKLHNMKCRVKGF